MRKVGSAFTEVALEGPETAAARKKVIGFLTKQASKIDSIALSAAGLAGFRAVQ